MGFQPRGALVAHVYGTLNLVTLVSEIMQLDKLDARHLNLLFHEIRRRQKKAFIPDRMRGAIAALRTKNIKVTRFPSLSTIKLSAGQKRQVLVVRTGSALDKLTPNNFSIVCRFDQGGLSSLVRAADREAIWSSILVVMDGRLYPFREFVRRMRDAEKDKD